MKRSALKAARPAIDYARDRDRWADLIRQAHRAVEEDSPDARSRLADRAISARNVWNPPVAYPENLLCLAFAQMAYGWARQVKSDLRLAAAPVLMAAAGVAEQAMAQPVVTASPPPEQVGEAVVRLPYRDN